MGEINLKNTEHNIFKLPKNWSGDANHPDRTRTIQVPFNRYLNDDDCPPQDTVP